MQVVMCIQGLGFRVSVHVKQRVTACQAPPVANDSSTVEQVRLLSDENNTPLPWSLLLHTPSYLQVCREDRGSDWSWAVMPST